MILEIENHPFDHVDTDDTNFTIFIADWNLPVQLDPIDPADAAADGWDVKPTHRIRRSSFDLRPALAVAVEVTGKTVVRKWGARYVRGQVTFCGDGEKSVRHQCLIALSRQF